MGHQFYGPKVISFISINTICKRLIKYFNELTGIKYHISPLPNFVPVAFILIVEVHFGMMWARWYNS